MHLRSQQVREVPAFQNVRETRKLLSFISLYHIIAIIDNLSFFLLFGNLHCYSDMPTSLIVSHK